MNDIAAKIQDRAYQSPGRARAALTRSKLTPGKKRKLGEAIELWENEGSLEPPVVGALPPASAAAVDPHFGREVHEGEVVDVDRPVNTNGPASSLRSEGPFTLPLALNLNCFIRARLTPFGVHVLYAARGKVPVPSDLLARGAVWETTLAHFMIAFGDHLEGPDNDVPVVGFEIELYRLRP
jgi:hypothetical protein